MQKNDLMRYGDQIIRILVVREDTALMIDCLRKSMPKWMEFSELENYAPCTEEEMLAVAGRCACDYDSLDKQIRRFVHEHFTLIAGVLPCIEDDRKRCAMITSIASDRGISKQTIRNYLWLYLVYQDIAALAPKLKSQERQLTQDEKNMRWALNKYFYTRQKNSLNTAYTWMLKEKYCDYSGKLMSEYPTIHQFKYFYRKHRKLQTYYISRDGLKGYQRNERPLLGDGIQEFAPSIGVGMLDSTVCDIYLVNEAGNLVGRPILTACVDAYSGLCCGYALSWEGGIYSLRKLMANVIADKVEWCRRFGISLQREEWNCSALPATLVTDMGTEYKSENFEQIAELGVTLVNLPPYRPELKGRVEKFFDLMQSCYKGILKGKGVIDTDFQERGAHDYRKDACLTLDEFEKIVLLCIIYYNSKRTLIDFPYSNQMIIENVQPHASNIWNFGIGQVGANLIDCRYDQLIMTLMPRTTGRFCRNGLRVNKLRYKHDDYTEMYLKGGTVEVAYNPDDVSVVWLLEHGEYVRFELIEGRFKGLKLEDVNSVRDAQKSMEKGLFDANLRARIELESHIEAIANSISYSENINQKNTRNTRRREQDRTHIDFLERGMKNG